MHWGKLFIKNFQRVFKDTRSQDRNKTHVLLS